MGTVISGNVGPQDPIYGIDSGRIVKRLNARNWRQKAVCRSDRALTYYIWIEKVTRIRGGERKPGYSVDVLTFPGQPPRFECGGFYPSLEDALAHANGEDSSELARETRQATLDEYPSSRPAPFVIGRFYMP